VRKQPIVNSAQFRFGLETLIDEPKDAVAYRVCGPLPNGAKGADRVRISALRDIAHGKRCALLAHPASVDRNLTHTVDRVLSWTASVGAGLSALIGPQHGLRGEKQDNMVESGQVTDPSTELPVFSLYGESRRLTPRMAESFDILLFDLQDVGVRVYTFLTTLCYLLEELQGRPDKEVWVLDRPNPTGRAVEGLRLEPGWESFVGAAPVPMQHGMTLGEFALYYHAAKNLSSNLTIIPMTGWRAAGPREAWPEERIWVQPSPNMPGLYTARAYPGTVMVEGSTLSEGRGTTRPLSVIGHPEVDWTRVLGNAAETGALAGCAIRRIAFQPTFHKHSGTLTPGIEIVTEGRFYDPATFRPYRLVAAIFKEVKRAHPEIKLWTDPPYEYEFERRPIDVITGGTRLREWVENPKTNWRALDDVIAREEEEWRTESAPFFIYD